MHVVNEGFLYIPSRAALASVQTVDRIGMAPLLPITHPRDAFSLLQPGGEGPSYSRPNKRLRTGVGCRNHVNILLPRIGGRGLVVARAGRVERERDVWNETSSYDYAPPATSSKGGSPPPQGPGNNRNSGGGDGLSGFTKALIAASFVVGLGAGVYFASEVNVEPSTVASTQIIDQQTPNSQVCMANGYSSMVFDQRIFVSFNPFNVYVTQPEVKPGCILRRSNVNVLEKRGLVKDKEVDLCKRGMNTFAYVGDLNNQPEVSCVYHSEDAENQFIVDPKKAVMGDGYRPQKNTRQ